MVELVSNAGVAVRVALVDGTQVCMGIDMQDGKIGVFVQAGANSADSYGLLSAYENGKFFFFDQWFESSCDSCKW